VGEPEGGRPPETASAAATLEALIGLTRLPVDAGDEPTLARSLVDRLRTALGARSGFFIRLDGETSRAVTADTGVDPGVRAAFDALPVAESTTVRRFRGGGSAFVEMLSGSSVDQDIVDAAGRAGYVAWAAFPIRDDGRLTSYVVLYFDEPPDWMSVDSRTLDAIGAIVSISIANFRLREGLVVSEERYRTLFEESPEAYLVLDDAGRVVAANTAASRLYRLPDGTIAGHHLADLHEMSSDRTDVPTGGPETDGPGPDGLATDGPGTDGPPGHSAEDRATEVDRLLAPGGRATMRGTGLRADGSRFPDEVFLSRVAIGHDRRVLARVHDLTEQERLQQELVQAQKMEAIGMLVSGVAHELNNPLAAIIGYSTLLRRDERLPEEMRHDAVMLLQEADRTRRIVQNLLDFARQRSPERHSTAVRALVASTLQLQSYSIRAGRIDMNVAIPSGLPAVDVDRAQMQQVLLNLTQNAIQAIRDDGQPGSIDVTAESGAGRDGRAVVRLRITDSGPGVPEHLRSQLFLPFFTTKAPGEGTGLGLSVSFGIVTAHGGRLWFEPGPNDRGASFVLELPVEGAPIADPPMPTPIAIVPPQTDGATERLAEPESVRRAASDATAATAADGMDDRPRVLVLDDEPSILAFLGKALAIAGYRAIITSSGSQAVAAVREAPFDAVLCDHRMSGMSGTEAYEAVTAVRPELRHRFVFMSGDVLNPQLVDFATQRGIRLLPKPFDLDTVGRTLRDVLATREDSAQG